MPATALLDVAICLLKHASRTNHGRDRKNRVFTRLLTLHKFNEQNTQAADASTCQNCIPAIQGMTPRKKGKVGTPLFARWTATSPKGKKKSGAWVSQLYQSYFAGHLRYSNTVDRVMSIVQRVCASLTVSERFAGKSAFYLFPVSLTLALSTRARSSLTKRVNSFV